MNRPKGPDTGSISRGRAPLRFANDLVSLEPPTTEWADQDIELPQDAQERCEEEPRGDGRSGH